MFDTVVGTAAEAFTEHALPWLGKKAVEVGRYGASELMRNKNLQKKAINYGINKMTPFIQESVGSAMDQLSTKVRPNVRYKTDRKDLDGSGLAARTGGSIVDDALKSGVYGSPFQVDLKKGYELLTDPELFAPVRKIPKKDALALVKYYKDEYEKAKANGYKKSYNTFVQEMGWGAGVDIHKWIGKIPHPKAGWTPGKYKYMGPYNPLEKQLSYDPETGEVTEWRVKPYNKVDEIAAYHDICYDVGKNKGDCDREMVKSLDQIPFGEMPKWGSTARFLINTKKKLGLGLQKNAQRR